MYDIRHLNDNEISVRAGDAAFPVPFREGLLYSSPARGTWTIAHTSMLIPGSHQIFVCPSCCLRGVVLSAEEMGAMDRFSMLEFTDDHILRGDLEDMIRNGETVSDFIFLGSKITTDGDCSHEIKRCLLLGRKVMTNLDSILKSRDITLPTKVCLVKAMVFPVVMYGCESWTIKKAEC